MSPLESSSTDELWYLVCIEQGQRCSFSLRYVFAHFAQIDFVDWNKYFFLVFCIRNSKLC